MSPRIENWDESHSSTCGWIYVVCLCTVTKEHFLFVLSLCEVACLKWSGDDFSKSPKHRAQYFFFFFLTADVLIACLLRTEKYKDHYGATTYLWAWADVLMGYCGNFLSDFPYFTFPVHSIRQSQSSFPSSWETNLLILSLLQSISGSLHLHMKPSVFNRAF